MDEQDDAPTALPEYRISRTAIVLVKVAGKWEPHRYLGQTVPGRVHLMHMREGTPFLREEDGLMGLLTQRGWDEMQIDGELKVVEPPSTVTARMLARSADWDFRDIIGDPTREPVEGEDAPLEPAAAKMMAQVLLCDENDVPNGVVAMRRFLAERWPGEFEEAFGPHDKPETIKRWRSERGSAGDRLLGDFIRMWGRTPRKPYEDGVVHEVVQIHCLRARTEPGSIQEIVDQVGTVIREINAGEHEHYPKPDKGHDVPSYSTVYRAWKALENSFTVVARDGDAVMRADWRGAGRPLVAKRPLQIGVADHTRIPIAAVVDLDHDVILTEVWLSTLMDVSSRACLAWVITAFPPSFWTVAELLRRSNLPKRPPPDMAARYPGLRRLCGRLAEYVIDNGREFRGYAFENASAAAGFAVRFAPIKRPTYKAVGERFFRTILAKLSSRLPGRTLPIEVARKADYNPTIDAVVTLDDLEAILNQAIAEYHTEPHAGIRHRQPALMFHKGTGGFIDVAHDLEGFLNELMEVIEEVQVDMAGVTRWGLRYHDVRAVPGLLDDLTWEEPVRSRREDATATTKAKFNRMNIGVLKVWNRRTRKYVDLRCEHASYAEGMPLDLHLEIMAQAEAEAAAFNTEAERMAARTRRIDAIRALDGETRAEQEAQLTKLIENTRIRGITGNIVEAGLKRSTAVTIGDFIPHDVAALSSLDAEVLSPRKPVSAEGGGRKKRTPARDRRDAGQPRPAGNQAPDGTTPRPVRGGGSRRVSGDYE